MPKTLTKIGNSLGLIIEKPILELLDISEETPLEIKTDGVSLVIRPLGEEHEKKMREASHAIMKAHEHTFRKLAE